MDWLRRMRQPSLIRRLLLAQTVGLALLWAFITTLMLHDAQDGEDLLRMDSIYEVAATIASTLANDPEGRQQTLNVFTKALQSAYGDGVIVPQIFVWQGDSLVYHSMALPSASRPATTDQITQIQAADGSMLRARTVAHPSGGIRVAIATPGLPTTLVSFHSHGFYLMPLFISLPFLALPAFFSLRMALRPWQRVADEIAARKPGDLQALRSSPPHYELRPLVESVNALLAQARSSLQRERNLTADAAHELRTPLAALHVNAEALLERTSAAEERELLDNLLRCNERVTRVVSQLLQLMRSEAAPTQQPLQTLCLYALAQDRLSVLDALAQKRQIDVELLASGDPPFGVAGSMEAFTSLIDNLVENAIKYSPLASTVSLHLSRSAHHVELRVKDSGPGIPPSLHERVFDRFYRAPNASQSGSGLGLTIARAAAQRHGGRISLSTPPEGGLEVLVQLMPSPGSGGTGKAA